jgi:hypothetical protein
MGPRAFLCHAWATGLRWAGGPWGAALVVLVAARFLFVAPRLIYPDLGLNYPFQAGDTQDWIANGLWWAGHDLRFTGRPPLFPWVLAVLERWADLRYAPLLATGLVHGTILAVYRFLARSFSPSVSFLVAAFVLASTSFFRLSLDMMADVPATCLLFLSLASFVRAGHHPRSYLAAGLWGGLSYLTQQTALLLPLPFGLVLLVRRRGHLRGAAFPWLLGGALVWLAFPLGWTAIKRLVFGVWGDLRAIHWGLLSPEVSSAGHYLLAWLGFAGLPATLVVGWGVLRAVRRRLDREPHAPALALVAVVTVFFVFFYRYEADRFLVYGFLPATVFFAEGLAGLPPGAVRGAVWALMVMGSLLPAVPDRRGPEVALWPRPYLALTARPQEQRAGPRHLQLQSVRLALPDADPWPSGPWGWFLHPVGSKASAPPPHLARGMRGLLLLHSSGPQAVTIHSSVMANLLRKPTAYLNETYLTPYWHFLSPRPLEDVLGHRAFAVQVEGLSGEWLLLVAPSAHGPLAGPPRQRLGSPGRIAREVAVARRLRRWVKPHDHRVIVVASTFDRRPARLYLPFLLPTYDILFVTARQDGGVPKQLRGSRVLDHEAVGDIQVTRVQQGILRSVIFTFPATRPGRRPAPQMKSDEKYGTVRRLPGSRPGGGRPLAAGPWPRRYPMDATQLTPQEAAPRM